MNNESQLSEILSNTLVSTTNEINWEVVKQHLIPILNDLADHDFHRLLTLLYQIDVSEIKVRKALQEKSTQNNAGEILADLIIERQKEKIELRKRFSK